MQVSQSTRNHKRRSFSIMENDSCWALRNLLTLFSSALTFILICQVLYSFVVTKPTTTSQEEKRLRTEDLPETLVCMEPGLDSGVLKKYGYKATTYWRGSMDQRKFVGWTGDGNGNKSSYALLEEALTVDANFRSLFKFVSFRKVALISSTFNLHWC